MATISREYFVWSPDLGSDIGDAERIWAGSSEQAAQEWAEQEDRESADYWIVGGDGATVCVSRDETGSDVDRYRVVGEQSVNYYARPAWPVEGA